MDTRMDVAWHEMGHVVTAMLAGGEVKSVKLHMALGGESYGATYLNSKVELSGEAYLAVAVAGYVAERMHQKQPMSVGDFMMDKGCLGDSEAMTGVLHDMGMDVAAFMDSGLMELMTSVQKAINDNKEFVAEAAEVMAKRGDLKKAHIARALENHPLV
jgi:hypothetical protein